MAVGKRRILTVIASAERQGQRKNLKTDILRQGNMYPRLLDFSQQINPDI